MPNADELLAAGDLEGARAALVETVRSAPADQSARLFLLQLMMIGGEWDKARAQAKALASLSPQAEMLSVLCGQLIAGESQRQDAFAGRQPFKVLVPTSQWVDDLAAALTAAAAGDHERASTLRDQAFDAAPDTPGECDGRRFVWIADADARFGPCLEVIIAGSWGLVPFEAVEAINSEGATDLRDLAWLPVQLALRSGQTAAAFIPTRYPETAGADAALRLARATTWRSGPLGDTGVGQRLFAVSDGDDIPILSIRRLTMLGAG